MFDAKADEDKGCDVTFFAVVRGVEPSRLQVDGVEQLLDTGWSFDYRVPAGQTKTVTFAFLRPVGGALVTVQEEWFRCNPSYVPPSTNWDARQRTGMRGG
jgi:hypothetical protein